MTVTDKKSSIINLTEAAYSQVKYLLQNRGKQSLGIRVSVKSGGCSGLSYVFEYTDNANPRDEMIEEKDIKIFIDAKAVLYLIGTTLDYIDEKVKSGFIFLNPNAKGQCGCGESFHV